MTVARSDPRHDRRPHVFDLAAASSVDLQSSSAIRQAEYLRLYDRLSLVDLVERYPGRRGVRRVRVALARIEAAARRVATAAHWRNGFCRSCAEYGLPRPRLNDWITVGEERFQVDCLWHGTGQVVELDSWEAHGTRSPSGKIALATASCAPPATRHPHLLGQLDDEPEAVASDLAEVCLLASAQ